MGDAIEVSRWELALKVCIAKSFQPNVIPDKAFVNAIFTHNSEQLLAIAGLAQRFKSDSTSNAQFAAAWGVASKWTESSRYELTDNISAASLISAIADPQNGVFNG